MGTPVPDTMPELIDEKFYCSVVDAFFDLTEKTGCQQELVARIQCCNTGGTIKWWKLHGYECQDGQELVDYTGFTAQRLVAVHGPYDSAEECHDNCPLWWE